MKNRRMKTLSPLSREGESLATLENCAPAFSPPLREGSGVGLHSSLFIPRRGITGGFHSSLV